MTSIPKIQFKINCNWLLRKKMWKTVIPIKLLKIKGHNFHKIYGAGSNINPDLITHCDRLTKLNKIHFNIILQVWKLMLDLQTYRLMYRRVKNIIPSSTFLHVMNTIQKLYMEVNASLGKTKIINSWQKGFDRVLQ